VGLVHLVVQDFFGEPQESGAEAESDIAVDLQAEHDMSGEVHSGFVGLMADQGAAGPAAFELQFGEPVSATRGAIASMARLVNSPITF
jgi:hypothetical protein